MKSKNRPLIKLTALTGLLLAFGSGLPSFGQGTAFTYQGQLNNSGNPANGTFDLTFALYDAASGGTQLGGVVTNTATAISNGLFTVTLEFGNQFPGADRWLEIAVRTNGAGAFATLSPRQQLSSTPYAVQAGNAAAASSVAAGNITGTLTASQLPSAVVTNGASGVTFTGTFSGSGAGMTNVPGTTPWQTSAGTSLTAAANHGYLLTNDTTTTVFLPANASVGDIVTVSGMGSGGFQVMPAPGQALSGAGIAPAGVLWLQSANAPALYWTAVASSADGSKLVATSGSAAPGQIYTSTDAGFTWSASTNSPSLYWTSVASSADGTRLVAAGDASVYTSTDSSVTWSNHTPPAAILWRSVASSADGAKLVAAGQNGVLFTSSDGGVNWTQALFPLLYTWASVASSADGTKLVAVVDGQYGSGPVTPIFTSTNSGATWSTNTTPVGSWQVVASSADGSRFAAGGLAYIYTSSDSGLTWSASNNAPAYTWVSVAASADAQNLAAAPIVPVSPVFVSRDGGTTWVPSGSPSDHWSSLAWSADGSRLVAVSGGSLSASRQIWTSIAGYPGAPGTTAQFQYVGSGLWRPMNDSVSQLVGTIPISQLPSSLVTNGQSGITLSGSFAGNASGTFSGDGGGLTNLNASQLTSGSIPDARLSSNVALRSGGNTFSGNQTITGGGAGSLFLDNMAEVFAKNSSGAYEGFLWPRWNDNVSYLNYGSGGFNIRNNSNVSTMFMQPNGNVGIATPSPARMLQLGGPPNTEAMIRFSSTASDNSGGRTWEVGVPKSDTTFTGKFYSFVIDDTGLGTDPEFLIQYGTGNVGIGTTNPTSKLHVVGNIFATGTITPNSDRNLKTDFASVDVQTVLDKVAKLPIQQWRFLAESQGVKHVGPMAQDFSEAFGLGERPTAIATVDADGIALAAIQGLNQKLEQKEREITELKQSVADLKRREAQNADLKRELEEIKAALRKRLGWP